MSQRHPWKTHHAAARRLLAAARASLRRASLASAEASSYWLLCACEDLLHADDHRALARRWRTAPSAVLPAMRLAKTRLPAEPPNDAAGADERSPAPRLIEGYYLAARQALRLARLYAREPDTTGRRERACIERVLAYRVAIRDLRAGLGRATGPGLHKATSERSADEAATATGS